MPSPLLLLHLSCRFCLVFSLFHFAVPWLIAPLLLVGQRGPGWQTLLCKAETHSPTEREENAG